MTDGQMRTIAEAIRAMGQEMRSVKTAITENVTPQLDNSEISHAIMVLACAVLAPHNPGYTISEIAEKVYAFSDALFDVEADRYGLEGEEDNYESEE